MLNVITVSIEYNGGICEIYSKKQTSDNMTAIPIHTMPGNELTRLAMTP